MPSDSFPYSEDFSSRPDVLEHWKEHGYFIIRNLLCEREIEALRKALEDPEGACRVIHTRSDGQGRDIRVALWNQPGRDLTGMVARSHKLVQPFEQALGGEVYHYHTKVVMKEAGTTGSGAFNWHQDYGYWYENGIIYPNLGTVWIAVDRATKENGCVEVLSGSHKVGRIAHHRRGEQACADLERVRHIAARCPSVHAELEPGDAIFFHCNLLHQSAQNNSTKRRWGFLVSYNRADNNPVKKHHHPCYTPLKQVPNSAILESKGVRDFSDKEYYEDPKKSLALLPQGTA